MIYGNNHNLKNGEFVISEFEYSIPLHQTAGLLVWSIKNVRPPFGLYTVLDLPIPLRISR
jgi:hypothetical protein